MNHPRWMTAEQANHITALADGQSAMIITAAPVEAGTHSILIRQDHYEITIRVAEAAPAGAKVKITCGRDYQKTYYDLEPVRPR